MGSEQAIPFGEGEACELELESLATAPATDPELTVSKHAVRGLKQGELFVLVTRTQAPAIVRVELAEQGTGLPARELERIRSGAERILRSRTV
jgi:hypothetical protein